MSTYGLLINFSIINSSLNLKDLLDCLKILGAKSKLLYTMFHCSEMESSFKERELFSTLVEYSRYHTTESPIQRN